MTEYVIASSGGWAKEVMDFMVKGGVFMLPLAMTSVVALAAVIYKCLSLSKGKIAPESLVDLIEGYIESPKEQTEKQLLRELSEGESALARLGQVVIKHRGRTMQDITFAVEAASRAEVAQFYAGIGLLDNVITIAPLLGLLGTAAGVVTIFEGVSGSTDQMIIAKGIAVALNTTIFGLVIAVPSVVAHGYFTRKIEVYTARIEGLLADMVHSFEGVVDRKEQKKR